MVSQNKHAGDKGLVAIESVPQSPEIEKDALKLFKNYSWPKLKFLFHNMNNLSDYEKRIMKRALEMHSKKLRDKLNESKSSSLT